MLGLDMLEKQGCNLKFDLNTSIIYRFFKDKCYPREVFLGNIYYVLDLDMLVKVIIQGLFVVVFTLLRLWQMKDLDGVLET